jgi:hypothetical protein
MGRAMATATASARGKQRPRSCPVVPAGTADVAVLAPPALPPVGPPPVLLPVGPAPCARSPAGDRIYPTFPVCYARNGTQRGEFEPPLRFRHCVTHKNQIILIAFTVAIVGFDSHSVIPSATFGIQDACEILSSVSINEQSGISEGYRVFSVVPVERPALSCPSLARRVCPRWKAINLSDGVDEPLT